MRILILAVSAILAVHAQKEDVGGIPSVCVDRSAVCGDWVNYCDKIPDGTFQKHWCPKTCKRCNEKGIVLSDAEPNLPPSNPNADGNDKNLDSSSTSTSTSASSSAAASDLTTSSGPTSSSSLASSSSSGSPSSESTVASSGSTDAASTSSSVASSTDSGSSSSASASASPSSESSASTTSVGPSSSISSDTSSSASSTTAASSDSSSASTAASDSSSTTSASSSSTGSGSSSSSSGSGISADSSSSSAITGAPSTESSNSNSSSTLAASNSNDTSSTIHPGLKSIFDENPLSKISENGSFALISNSNSSNFGFPEYEKPYLCQPDWRLIPKLNDDNIEMAIKLYRKAIDDSPKDNIVFSPTSIALLLGLMEIGVKSNALEEIHKGIAKSLSLDENADAFAALLSSLRGENGQNKDYRLNILNSLYIDNNFPVQQSFIENINKCYQAKIANFSFQRESDQSRVKINDDITEKSEYKIKNLFPPGSIDSDDRLILINTIHMFGEFLHSFQENGRTYNRLFYPPNNAPGQEVTMMNTEGYFRYYENSELQVLGIDYKHHELTLFVFLPHNREGLSQFERTFDSQQLQKYMNLAKDERVDVTIPKFAINYRLQLKDSLKILGIKQLFDISADMSGISKKKDLFVTNAVHQSFFKVAEDGTESSPSKGPAPDAANRAKTQFVFHAEHSFVFAVRHDLTKSLVFLGRVVNGNIKD